MKKERTRRIKWMCAEACIVNTVIDGALERKRFKFGEFVVAPEPPNHHFLELEVDEFDSSPREIIARRLDDAGIAIEDYWTDDNLMTIYHNYRMEEDKKVTRDKLKKRCQEIGAKYHHMWSLQQVRDSIVEREAELEAKEYRKVLREQPSPAPAPA